jgi:hypothetical protein
MFQTLLGSAYAESNSYSLDTDRISIRRRRVALMTMRSNALEAVEHIDAELSKLKQLEDDIL